jgi:hypothetical protein
MRRSPFPSSGTVTFAAFVTFSALAVYAILVWLGHPAGSFSDWMIGLGGFWWLLGVVTIPWNIHFRAKEVRRDIEVSRNRELSSAPNDTALVERIAQRSLYGALLIHALTAIGFASLSYFEITTIGWAGCVAALALTAARPAARLYAYTLDLLAQTSDRIRFPIDDIRDVKDRLALLEQKIEILDQKNPDSWASNVSRDLGKLDAQHHSLRVALETASETNERDHRAMTRDAERIGERVSEDILFLGHVREMIQFLKNA